MRLNRVEIFDPFVPVALHALFFTTRDQWTLSEGRSVNGVSMARFGQPVATVEDATPAIAAYSLTDLDDHDHDHADLHHRGHDLNPPVGEPPDVSDQTSRIGPADVPSVEQRGRCTLSDVLGAFESIAKRNVPPDPSVLKAIGLNHRLETAVADLVDNSLDAAATRVLVRFVLRAGRARAAPRRRRRSRHERPGDRRRNAPWSTKTLRSEAMHGHYGMGLKSATFSQATVLTVLSRSPDGVTVGRTNAAPERTLQPLRSRSPLPRRCWTSP